MADNITYRFIQNVGDYFPSGYFSEDFITKVQTCAGRSADDMKALCSPYVQIRGEYEEYKNFIINGRGRIEDKIKHTHDWHTTLLRKLGYDTDHAYQEAYVVKDGTADSPAEIIPVRHIIRSGEQVTMLIMEMQNLITINDTEPDGLFKQQYEDDRTSGQQRYYAGQWKQVIPARYLDRTRYHFSPAIINKAITQIFLMPEERRPHYVLMLAGNTVFLFDRDKWSRGSYLQFSLDDLYFQAQIKNYRLHYALFHLLCCKETLAADGQTVLMDTLIEESYKNAYEVTKDLKEGVIFAVETLANEALYYMRNVAHKPFGKYDPATDTYDETDDSFEAEVKDDCLTIIYRLLFLFYAESRDELEILPVGDEVYKQGYSLESLRDLEMMRLNSQASRDGYFFDDSIRHLFGLLASGHHVTDTVNNKSFRVRPIDSPLFNDRNLHHLAVVRIRNVKWQEIIRALSLSKKKNYCGRISYANLGVNQLGSVYESLLAFRGFYAEEDYIEVHKANEPQDGTFLIPYSRMADFDLSEVLTDAETGAPQILPKGTFVYRLNGRDRQKSASYYTPEVLTRSTVKYTLKSIIDDVRDNKRKATELLELKILEPAMGAAAFQNEVINQLAEAYLLHQQRQLREAGRSNWRIAPDQYRNELQKVKAYIATHNVYGVDLNPTAVELGKLSLWLNVIHKDMETPFFANRICVGNAVIGAWLKVYSKGEVLAKKETGLKPKLIPTAWWTHAPHKVSFNKNSVKRTVNEVYHFLLPDQNMLAVRGITEQKKQHEKAAKSMSDLIKEWTAPISEVEFAILQRLSRKIDYLLKEYFGFQQSIEAYTQNKRQIWGIPGDGMVEIDNYEEKQRFNDTRYRHDNAYFRLKMVMDYWCALWFWEYKDAALLPKRREYWSDIEAMLDVSDSQLNNATKKAVKAHVDEKGQYCLFNTSSGMDDLFNQAAYEEQLAMNAIEDGSNVDYNVKSDEDSEIVRMSKEEILTKIKGKDRGFFDDSERFGIVKKYADRYHFFHPMLEFLEVFWLRDGFDVICGNPPWLKLEFDEQGILSEKYPEVAIRKVSAPEARKMRDKMFVQIPATEELYRSEEIETACSSIFMNAYCNYPLLEGQKTNLYKCVLENGFNLMSDKGFIGLLHPEGIFEDPKGQPLRKEVYPRLRYHFQYENELNLFAGTNDHGRMRFGENVYGSHQNCIDFFNMNNVFHPSTVDACFAHDGHGICGGIKDENGKWNVNAHHDRIVHFTNEELQLLSDTFEDGNTKDCAKLVSIHASHIINVIKKIAYFTTHVRDKYPIITTSINETHGVDDGVMKRETRYPDTENYEMIYSGPHFHVANPYYKTPLSECTQNSDYENLDLTCIEQDYSARTNYVPIMPLEQYKSYFKGFVIGQDNNGNNLYDKWADYYKVGFRRMMGPTSERTLICAALCSSIVMDFFVKTIGAVDLFPSRMQSFPLGVDKKYQAALYCRTLMLNCLTTAYADLWEEMWDAAYKQETWSKDDARLKPFSTLTERWQWATPLRNYYERRQALVEIDVISAMALGLSLQDLEMIYTIQFPVLQQNENDTWYDAEGKIVFTCSKGLTGVGLDRKRNAKTGMLGWEDIRGEQLDENTFAGTAPTHTHTIDPAKSELYGGQQQTFVAPYTRCDRIADYRTAWAHFEKVFNK